MKCKWTFSALSFVLATILVLCAYPPGARAVIIPGSEWTLNGHHYALLESASWTSSQAEAVTLGANLVTINNIAENDFVFDTYANFGGSSRTLWIGLQYVDDGDGLNEPQPGGGGVIGTDDWQWVSGDQATYRNWWPTDPNGYAGEPFVAIVPPAQSPTAKQWFDATDDGSGYNVHGVIEFAMLSGDFDGDGDYDCSDVDALIGVIADGDNNLIYDLTADGLVNTADLTQWLSFAGAHNLPSGNPYLPGDANLDGVVDGSDFVIWNSHKFTSVAEWCSGDFNADGVVDGSDFVTWNGNKFTSSDSLSAVPEPSSVTWILLLAACWFRRAVRVFARL